MNISFDNALQMMSELNTPYVRILDARDKKIMDFENINSVEGTIDKLKTYRESLAGYGIITIIAATEKIKAANWQSAYHWRVTVQGGVNGMSGQQNNFPHHTGYVSQREAQLTAELEALKMQIQFQGQIDALTRKLEDKGGSDFTQYLPLAALALKIPADQVAQMMGAMRPQGMAGTQTQQPQLQLQMTEQEMQAKLDNIMAHLKELITKVGAERVEKLLIGISRKENPAGTIDTALTFL